MPNPRFVERIREQLRLLGAGPPGERFQELYRRNTARVRKRRGGILLIGGGILLILTGIILYPVPGPPSTLMVLVGLALVSQGWVRAARFLDRLELRLRSGFTPLWEGWQRLPLVPRAAFGFGGVMLFVICTLSLYHLIAD